MSKDAYYFPHDSNARTDTKIVDMMYDYGVAGYGMYWFIIEIMRETDSYKLENNKRTWRALASQMRLDMEQVKKFIEDSISEYELFQSDEEHFWSESLLRRMDKVEEIKNKRRESANKRWGKKEEEKEVIVPKVKKDKKTKPEEFVKLEFTENVKLSVEKYNKLLEEYEAKYIESKILALENYIADKPSKYKNHYLTLLQWIKKDGEKAVLRKAEPVVKEESKPEWAEWD